MVLPILPDTFCSIALRYMWATAFLHVNKRFHAVVLTSHHSLPDMAQLYSWEVFRGGVMDI